MIGVVQRVAQRLSPQLRLPLALTRFRWWLAALLAGAAAASLVVWSETDLLDTRVYDRIVAANPRPAKLHTARVVLDQGVPLSVSRQQALTLYALAIERLMAMGASAVMLDAQIALRNFHRDSFVACLPEASTPVPCSLRGDANCGGIHNQPRRAPLDIDLPDPQRLVMPIPLTDRDPPPWEWLFGQRPLPRLITPNLPPARDGVIRQAYLDGATILPALVPQSHSAPRQPCADNADRACLGLRFSASSVTIPISQLASCQESVWRPLAQQVQQRYVVLQLTDEYAAEDVHMTPMTLGKAGYTGLFAGGRIIEDSLETLLQGDGPRSPAVWLQALVILLAMLLAVGALAFLRVNVAVLIGGGLAAAGWQFAPLLYPYASLPATALLAAVLTSGAVMLAGHISLNTRHNGRLARFMPPQIRTLLLNSRSDHFAGRQIPAIVLMSDLAGYTTVTALLPGPKALFELLNRYLDDVTPQMQQLHGAWLEAYVGDLVCFYWPRLDEAVPAADWRAQALAAAVDLVARQEDFFRRVPILLAGQIPPETAIRIGELLSAGVALTEGEVFLGELGPSQGVRKFGILGDPLNQGARLEALTRHFSATLLVTDTFVATARQQGLLVRRLAAVRLKGRLDATEVWAVHPAGEGVQAADVEAWSQWLAAFEAGNAPPPPARFALDAQTLAGWRSQGLWHAGQGCFMLDSK